MNSELLDALRDVREATQLSNECTRLLSVPNTNYKQAAAMSSERCSKLLNKAMIKLSYLLTDIDT